MRILAIDPGPETSGVVLWDGTEKLVRMAQPKYANDVLAIDLDDGTKFDWLFDGTEMVVFEKVESYGMTVGATVFETVFWTGRFFEAAVKWAGCARIPRRDVKLQICGSSRAKDANIRQALIDKYGPVGTKKNPGPLYGVKSHAWSALALAVTFAETST